jgi:hypothetical protein
MKAASDALLWNGIESANVGARKGTRAMIYAEAAYFEGVHVAHVAAWHEHCRLKQIDHRCARRSSNVRQLANRMVAKALPQQAES